MLWLTIIVVILVSASGFRFFWQKNKHDAAPEDGGENRTQLITLNGTGCEAIIAQLTVGECLDLVAGDKTVNVACRIGSIGLLPKEQAANLHQLVTFGAVRQARVHAVDGVAVVMEPIEE